MRKQRKLLILGGAGLLALALAGTYLLVSHRRPGVTAVQSATTPRVWIIAKHALDQLTHDPGARAAITGDTIYSPGYDPANAASSERGLYVIPARSYQSEAKIESDVAAHKIPSYVKAILYDNETWALTPDAEKHDPVLYYQRGYALAHAHGYAFIATPVPRTLAPSVAHYADVVDIQAQFAQSSSSAYLAAVQEVIDQVKQANPKAVVVSGLSTNPSAGDPTPQQLLDIAKATYPGLARGWWLNVPGKGTACPKCNQPRPDIGIKFLQMLGKAS